MRSERGFSLVELMVAIMIFAVGILATAGLLGAGYRYQGKAQIETELTTLAEAKVEDLRAVAGTERSDTVQLVPGGSLTSDLSGYTDTTTLAGRRYGRRWRVALGPAGVRRVTVQVRRLDPPGPESGQLTTNIYHD